MKIPLPFLLLFAVVNSAWATNNQPTSNSSPAGQSIDLSMDLTADFEDGESKEGKSQVSASTPFATYSASSQAAPAAPEFGMRNPQSVKSSDSHHNQQQQQSSQSNSNYASSGQVSYEPISTSYKVQSESGVVTRDYASDLYRKPVFESAGAVETMNAESDQSYGQAQTLSNEMNSPYYSKTTDQSGDHPENSGDFSSMGMSVDDAFRKYFPSKEPEEGEYDAAPQQAAPTGQTQYINTYASEGSENAQQQQQIQPGPEKELFSIDSLREIVEKQPLARPDPFDPPSPPLSAFLAPQEGAIRETPAQSSSVPQYGIATQQSEIVSHSQPQQHSSGSQYVSQPQTNYGSLQGQQANYVPQSQPSYFYTKETVTGSNGHKQTSAPEENDTADETEDEGLPYTTENLDEDGKKVSYVYSRPVRLPDVTRTKVVEPNSGAQYNEEMEHIYRKPVSYENEDDSIDQTDEGYGGQRQVTPNGYEESDQAAYQIGSPSPLNANKHNSSPMPYQQGVLSLPLTQSVAPYSDEGNYNSKHSQQQQWLAAGNDNRPDFAEGKDPNQPTAPIEYGGFVPIKKGNQGPNFQQVLSESYREKPVLTKPFFPEQRPYSAMPNGPESGYVGPNNISPSGHATGGHMSSHGLNLNFAPQSNGPKFGGNVNNFASKFSNLRFKPLYGKDAMKKLHELGISEDEFYGTVNKILQKSNGNGPRPSGPFFKGSMPYMPKANLYRAPPKKGHNARRPQMTSGNKMHRPLSNGIVGDDTFDFNYFKDGLPQGASYNPRDVGLDESVLAQIQLQDSGIGGYRFPTIIPTGANMMSTAGTKPYRTSRPSLSPFKKSVPSVPHAMNSMVMPFVLNGPRPFRGGPAAAGRLPYSSSGKGYRSQYGYRAAASELKPQFVLPKKQFKFLGQPVALSSSNNPNPLMSASLDDSANALGNIFGIRSIKGIKSLVSYLTGGVSG